MTKYDSIIQHLIDIKSDVSGMKEHLKSINGSVGRHEKRLNKHDNRIGRISRQQAYYAGGISVVVLIGGFLLNKFL